jgi:carboxypeptidase D
MELNPPTKLTYRIPILPLPKPTHKHQAANVLFVDQPVGTGYSFTGTRSYCSDDNCIEKHFFTFLQALFRLHPWLLKGDATTTTRPVFFSGESQAGHYIPSMIDFILTQNERDPLPPGEVAVDVQGMAIGNGWFDPPNQYDVSAFAHGVGMISHGQYLTLQKRRAECVKGLGQGRYFNPVCFSLLDEVVAATGTETTGYVSLYDYRLFDNPGDRQFPPGHKLVEKYLNKAEVKAALHASESPMVFQECTDPPYDHLKQQDGLGVMGEVKRILEGGKVRALFFNGAFDVICNHVGNELALKQLQWSGRTDFLQAPRGVWVPHGGSGKPGGYAKSSGPLTYLVVLNAGHMVPLDVPAAALDMIRRFLANQSFQDKQQAIGMSLEEDIAGAAVEGAAAPVALPSGPPTLKGACVRACACVRGRAVCVLLAALPSSALL